jgi:hypothetical protein
MQNTHRSVSQAALALALPLLHLRATGKLLSVPGRAMGPFLARLQPQLPEGGFRAAQAFLDDVVESLKQGGGGGEVGARLSAALPAIKELAAGAGGAASGDGGPVASVDSEGRAVGGAGAESGGGAGESAASGVGAVAAEE